MKVLQEKQEVLDRVMEGGVIGDFGVYDMLETMIKNSSGLQATKPKGRGR